MPLHTVPRSRYPMQFKAVLFDLDGTLLDTLADIADSANAALQRMGFPGHPLESYNRFVGDGVEILIRRTVPPDRGDEATVARCASLMREEYTARWCNKTRVYEGVAEMLDELVRLDLPMAVLSNKPHDFTQLCVKRFLPRWQFAVVQGIGPGLPRKPDPAAALGVAAQLGISPGEFLYMGDTDTDMRTAVSSGMYPAGVLWGFRDAEELLAHGAKTLLERPGDVPRFVHSRRVTP